MKERVRMAADEKSSKIVEYAKSSANPEQRYDPNITPKDARRVIDSIARRNAMLAAEEDAWTFSVAGEPPKFWKGVSEIMSSTADALFQGAQQAQEKNVDNTNSSEGKTQR